MIALRHHLRTLTWLALFALLGLAFAPTVSRALGVTYAPGMAGEMGAGMGLASSQGMSAEMPAAAPAEMPAEMPADPRGGTHAGMHHAAPDAEPTASAGHCGGTSLVHCALCCVGFAVAGLPPPAAVVFSLRPQGAGAVPVQRAGAAPRSPLRMLREARAPPLRT